MQFRTFSTALAVLALSTTYALANTAQTAAQQCIAKTGAPGAYDVSTKSALPTVSPGQSGTAAGAARVNDCLKDAYAVQYGARSGGVATAGPVGGFDRVNCDRILNRDPRTAAVYAAGSTILAGPIGAGVQASVYQRNLNYCLSVRSARPVNADDSINIGCSRRHGVIRGGSSLCISR